MSIPELKPCPFCGARALIYEAFPGSYIVHCVRCKCMFGRFFSHENDAIVEWNRRANDENAG